MEELLTMIDGVMIATVVAMQGIIGILKWILSKINHTKSKNKEEVKTALKEAISEALKKE